MITLEMLNDNMILTQKLQKYQFYHQAKSTGMNIVLAKKRYLLFKKKKQQKKLNLLILLWGKAFEKQTKRIDNQGKKQVDAITNQGKNLEALTNKDHEYKYKEILK